MSNTKQAALSASTISPLFFQEVIKPLYPTLSHVGLKSQIISRWDTFEADALMGPLFLDTAFNNICTGSAEEKLRVLKLFRSQIPGQEELSLIDFSEDVPEAYIPFIALVGRDSNAAMLVQKVPATLAFSKRMGKEIDIVELLASTLKLDPTYFERFDNEVELYNKRAAVEVAFTRFYDEGNKSTIELEASLSDLLPKVNKSIEGAKAFKGAVADCNARKTQAEKAAREAEMLRQQEAEKAREQAFMEKLLKAQEEHRQAQKDTISTPRSVRRSTFTGLDQDALKLALKQTAAADNMDANSRTRVKSTLQLLDEQQAVTPDKSPKASRVRSFTSSVRRLTPSPLRRSKSTSPDHVLENFDVLLQQKGVVKQVQASGAGQIIQIQLSGIKDKELTPFLEYFAKHKDLGIVLEEGKVGITVTELKPRAIKDRLPSLSTAITKHAITQQLLEDAPKRRAGGELGKDQSYRDLVVETSKGEGSHIKKTTSETHVEAILEGKGKSEEATVTVAGSL